MASRQPQQNKSHRGDISGRAREKANAKVAQEVNEQVQTLTKTTAAAKAAKSTEVIEQDGKSAKVLNPDDPTIAAVVAAADTQPAPSDTVDGVEEQGVEINESEMVLVRARYDVEAATVGFGTQYDFEEGRKYRIPRNAANHFEERELVDVLSA